MSDITSAGFIVVRRNKGSLEYLGLVAVEKEQKRSSGKFDVPKGRVDGNESSYECAMRECYEETGFAPDKSFVYEDSVSNGKLILWIAVLEDTPKITIKPNPESGKIEHIGHEWVPFEVMKNKCLRYLKSMILASKIIIDNCEVNP